ncbi:hypothetical protein [Amycolatopsis sp. NPDC102389]
MSGGRTGAQKEALCGALVWVIDGPFEAGVGGMDLRNCKRCEHLADGL